MLEALVKQAHNCPKTRGNPPDHEPSAPTTPRPSVIQLRSRRMAGAVRGLHPLSRTARFIPTRANTKLGATFTCCCPCRTIPQRYPVAGKWPGQRRPRSRQPHAGVGIRFSVGRKSRLLRSRSPRGGHPRRPSERRSSRCACVLPPGAGLHYLSTPCSSTRIATSRFGARSNSPMPHAIGQARSTGAVHFTTLRNSKTCTRWRRPTTILRRGRPPRPEGLTDRRLETSCGAPPAPRGDRVTGLDYTSESARRAHRGGM